MISPARQFRACIIRLAVVLVIAAAPVHAAEYVAGELYVKYTDSAARTAGGSPEAAIVSYGGFDIRQAFPVTGSLAVRRGTPEQMERRASLASIRRVRFPEDADMVTIARKLSADPAIEYAEPVWIDHLCRIPNDSLYLDNKQSYLDFVNAPEAWDIATGDSVVVIAIIDTGIDWRHPDLFANVWTNPGESPDNGVDDDDNKKTDDVHGWDFFGTDGTGGDNDPSPISNSHGTHVTGIAAAVTDNLIGVASLSDNVRFMPLKAGPGDSDQIFNGYEAILYAADMGADIINCSWGSYYFSATNREIVETVAGEGVLIVAAAGNENLKDAPFFPASYDPVLSVGAVDLYGYKTYYSNHGVYVDIAAPGTEIYSTIINRDEGPDYASLTGTSMASPVVAALAGLIKSQNPGFDVSQVKAQLFGTARPLASGEFRMGAGYIDAAAAVRDSVRYTEVLNVAISDSIGGNGDGIFRSGEVLDLTVTIRNIGVAVTGMTLTVDSLNGYLLAETGTAVTGPLAHGGEVVLTGIRLRVNPDAPWDADDVIRFTFTSPEGAAGTGSIMQRVNPSYATFSAGTVSLSFSGRGNIGYVDYPNNRTGSSFIIRRDDIPDQAEVYEPLVFEAGFMLGAGPDHVTDIIRGTTSETLPDSDFTAASAVTYLIDDVERFDTGTASFTDTGAGDDAYGVTVDFTGYSFPVDQLDQCVILSYLVRNTGDTNLEGVSAGLFFDFDLPSWDARNDYGYYVSEDDIIAVEEDATERANKITVGVTALPSIGTPAIIDNAQVMYYDDHFTEAEKWQALSDPSAWPEALVEADVSVVASAPSFDLPPGSAHRVTFIVGYGVGYNDLKEQLVAGRARASDIITAVEAPAGSHQPVAFGITGAYPNPFNPSTMIEYASPSGGHGMVTVYAMTGQKVRTLVDGDIEPGAHRVQWDGYDDTGLQVATGVYLVRFTLDGVSSVRRVTLVK